MVKIVFLCKKKMYIMKFILFRFVSSGDSRLLLKYKKLKKLKYYRRLLLSFLERLRRRLRLRSRRRLFSLERGRYRLRFRSRDRYLRRRFRSRDRRFRSYDRRLRLFSRSRRRFRYLRLLSRDR